MNFSLPIEVVLFPLLSILIYSVSLKGGPIFDDMEVLPSAQGYKWKWWTIRHSSRPLGAMVMALVMRWPGTVRGVHSLNCWIHALNAFLVEQLALSLGVDRIQAMAVGIFFVAMPFAANTVAYMSGLANLLSASFGLLGSLAILTHHGIWSIPCLVFAYLSKEDGLGFALTFMALATWKQEGVVLEALGGVMVLAALVQWKHLRRLSIETGDKEMAAIGLPVSLPQPQHGLTVLVATLRRIPFWALGLKQSPYHGSGLKK